MLTYQEFKLFLHRFIFILIILFIQFILTTGPERIGVLKCGTHFHIHCSMFDQFGGSKELITEMIQERIRESVEGANNLLSRRENFIKVSGVPHFFVIQIDKFSSDVFGPCGSEELEEDSAPEALESFSGLHEEHSMQKYCMNMMVVGKEYYADEQDGLKRKGVMHGITYAPILDLGEFYGGACDTSLDQERIYNVGVVYLGNKLPAENRAVLVAHEFSHAFGYPGHDEDRKRPECVSSQYLMTGLSAHHYRFNNGYYSLCSTEEITKRIDALVSGKSRVKNCLKISDADVATIRMAAIDEKKGEKKNELRFKRHIKGAEIGQIVQNNITAEPEPFFIGRVARVVRLNRPAGNITVTRATEEFSVPISFGANRSSNRSIRQPQK